MTAPDLAAALLKDVKRHSGWHALDPVPVMYEADVIKALTAALDGVDERAGEVLRDVTPGPWEADISEDGAWTMDAFDGNTRILCSRAPWPSYAEPSKANARFIAWCREGVPALIATVTAQAAGIEALMNGAGAASQVALDYIARAEAAETALAAMTKERDELAKTNNRQAACLHYTAAELGPDYVATVDGLPKAARHALAAERAKVAKLVEAANQARMAFAGYVSAESAVRKLDDALAAITEAGQ